MDPNTTLKNILALVAKIQRLSEIGHPTVEDGRRIEAAAQELADAVDALNDWIVRGGFLPAAWAPKK